MQKLQIAVVEDDFGDQEWLAEKIDGYCRMRDMQYTLQRYRSGEEFVAVLPECRFDIVFMDVYLGGMSGVEAARALRMRDKHCRLVFLTISAEFMPEGFSLNSAHYLIKPVKDEDFLQAMENCRIRNCSRVPLLSVISDRRTIRVVTRDIIYIDVNLRSVFIHTTGETLPVGRNFNATVECLLPDERFLLCNRGLLVNMDYIIAQVGNDFIMSNGEHLPMAPRRRKELIASYHKYVFNSLES